MMKFKKILVPLDSSELAERAAAPALALAKQALEPAIAVAKAVAAELTLLRVTSPAYVTVSPVITMKKRLREAEERERREAETYLQHVQAILSQRHISIKCTVASLLYALFFPWFTGQPG